MEARATLGGASVSRTFLAAVLVIVAMGLAAIGGYVAGSVFGGTAVIANPDVHAAPGTVLRQDTPAEAPAQVPDWIQREWGTEPAPVTTRVDDPTFISQYSTAPEPSSGRGYRELD